MTVPSASGQRRTPLGFSSFQSSEFSVRVSRQKTLKKAQLKQRVEEPNYELECELIHPVSYLNEELDDVKVATDLLLKLREFLEPWGGYYLEWVDNKTFQPKRRYGKDTPRGPPPTKGE